MSDGLATYSSVANRAGTVTSSATPVTTIAITPSAFTEPGELIIAVVFTADPTDFANLADAVDLSDGWVHLSSGYINSANPASLAMFGLIAPRSGASGYAGLGITPGVPYVCQTQSFLLPSPGRWHLGGRGRDNGAFADETGGTILTAPATHQPYAQCGEFVAFGYKNNGTARTVTEPSQALFERWDVSLTSPTYGIELCTDFNGTRRGFEPCGAVNGSVSHSSSTHRMGIRAMVPIIAHVNPMRRRTGQARRAG